MVDGQRFDGLARRFATATSRRGFLRGVVIGGAGSALAGRGHLAPDTAAQNAECASFCQQLPPGPERGRCVAEAANGTGLCFQCGPGSSDPDQQLCGGVCVDTATDALNCRQCGEVCDSGETCRAGVCTSPCQTWQEFCDGACVDTDTSLDYCGGCDTPCTPPANATPTCLNGICGFTCRAGFGDCDGDPANGCETNLQTDPAFCGSCDFACTPPANATATCAGGSCGFECLPGFGNCDGNPATGCESNWQTDPDHCGNCVTDCTAGPNEVGTCTEGECGTECAEGFSRCVEDGPCCPDGFCLNDTCVGGVCSQGALGCNPGPTHCYCQPTYAGPTVCTPAGGVVCSEQRCDADDPMDACPAGSYCILTGCDGAGTISGRCAPVTACPANLGCGTDNCHTGQTCQSDGVCRPE
jgi:hypothetical protein